MPSVQVFSYQRFSSLKQAVGDSIRRQTKRRDDWLARHDLVLDDSLTYRDCGKSAFRGRHAKGGELSHFLAAIDEGRVRKGDILIIEALDRLTRQKPLEAVGLVMRCLCLTSVADANEYVLAAAYANAEAVRLDRTWDTFRRNLAELGIELQEDSTQDILRIISRDEVAKALMGCILTACKDDDIDGAIATVVDNVRTSFSPYLGKPVMNPHCERIVYETTWSAVHGSPRLSELLKQAGDSVYERFADETIDDLDENWWNTTAKLLDELDIELRD